MYSVLTPSAILVVCFRILAMDVSISFTLSVFSFTDSISSFFSLFSLTRFFVKIRIDESRAAPAIVQPTGPAMASSADPPAIPPPPVAKAPPPSQARAALDAAAPDRVEMAAPVEAVPKVVATHIAAVGAMNATDAPAARPAPAPPAASLAAWISLSANSQLSVNFFLLISIDSKSASNSFGWLAMLFTRFSMLSMTSTALQRSI